MPGAGLFIPGERGENGVKQCKQSAKYKELAEFFLRHGGRKGRDAGGRRLFWRMINFQVITPQASY